MNKKVVREINGSEPTAYLKWVNGKLMQKHEIKVRLLHYTDDYFQYSEWITDYEWREVPTEDVK